MTQDYEFIKVKFIDEKGKAEEIPVKSEDIIN